MLCVEKYLVAKTLANALELKSQYPQGYYLAGGTDVIPLIKNGSKRHACLIDLNRMEDKPDKISMEGNILSIGGMVTHGQIAENAIAKKYFSTLAEACAQVGSRQIRTRGTIAGNLQNASPAGDSLPPLVAAGAELVYRTVHGKESISITDFFVGPGTTKLPEGAIIEEVLVPLPAQGWKGSYFKVGGRHSMTIAIASAAILFSEETGYKVAFGSVSPTVVQAHRTQAALNAGNEMSDLEQAVYKDICPIDDVRASAEYRRAVCSNFVQWLVDYRLNHM